VRALIVDDEPLARRGVLLRLRRFKDVEIVGECNAGLSAVAKILELSPDVVFLDVQMPGMDGFEVLRALPKDKIPSIVFITAYEEHALRAFEAHALDYLLKPVDDARFSVAVESRSQTPEFSFEGVGRRADSEIAWSRFRAIYFALRYTNWCSCPNRISGGYRMDWSCGRLRRTPHSQLLPLTAGDYGFSGTET
jgi:DNA-binding LytR/AlgR family response regulator